MLLSILVKNMSLKRFDKNDEKEIHKQRLYTGNLRTMKEKPIYDTESSDLTIYRLNYLRSFSIPIIIAVIVNKNENILKAKIPEGSRTSREKEISKTLSENEIQEIEKYLEKMNFWNLTPTEQRLPAPDGTRCLFEVYDKSKKYHGIERVNPGHYEETEYYAELINYLFDLADSTIPKEPIGGNVKRLARKLDAQRGT